MRKIIYSSLFLLTIMVIGIILAPYIQSLSSEGFDNKDLATPGTYPETDDVPILTGYFPYSGKKTVSNDSAYKMWWHYPTFTEGSYAQITNNIRYPNNPDIGRCTPADFCGALYKEKKDNPSNYVYPLPPAEEGNGARVNYYRTEPNLLSMSINTNENILY